ncbi:response regulator transcription factor [Rheinheimera metallidurans]|uniref:response regulator transcription factor n=1 Tax=Rheinheimera metallidurans TaxID=2925781 RepID=UPI0030022065
MDKFMKLIVLTEQDAQHSLTFLARSAGIDVEQKTKLDILYSGTIKARTLVAYPYSTIDWNKHGLSPELEYLLQKTSVCLFQTERLLVNAQQAVFAGLRGIIYRDEQPNRILTALKTMMQGELYYARTVMSELLDELLQQKRLEKKAPLCLPDNNLLTKQEKRIIQLVAEGARNKEIAENLEISAHTVKAHLASVFRKTQARNRVELLRWCNVVK